ncbi:hypothetical protein [Streptomyces sp. NPDC003697]
MTVLAIFLLVIGTLVILVGTFLIAVGAILVVMGMALTGVAAYVLIRRLLGRDRERSHGW